MKLKSITFFGFLKYFLILFVFIMFIYLLYFFDELFLFFIISWVLITLLKMYLKKITKKWK